MSNAYIVKNGKVICALDTDLSDGEEILYAFKRAKETINANRQYNLVNALTGQISREKKYDKSYKEGNYFVWCAEELNPREFYIENTDE